jgi:hypothetical protein
MKVVLVLFLFISFLNSAQIGTGQWRQHVVNKKAVDVAVHNNMIYTAFGNGLLEYDPEAGETSVWTKVNGLSDIFPTCLGQNASKSMLFVGYDNGNIDKLYNNRITNIPAIRLAQLQGSKRINRIVAHGNFIFVATGFGIVKIDPLKDEVTDTYYPTLNHAAILDVEFQNDSIFALTSNQVLKGKLSNVALADPSSWEVDERFDELAAHSYSDIEFIDNRFYIQFEHDDYGKDTVFQVTNTGKLIVSDVNDLEIRSIAEDNGRLVINTEGSILTYNSDNSIFTSIYAFNLGSWFKPLNSVNWNGSTWIADETQGLLEVVSFFTLKTVPFEGPPKNEFYSMDYASGRLLVAGGGLSSIANNFSGSGVYAFEDEKWNLFDRDNMNLWNSQPIWDFLSVSNDPSNENGFAVSTYSEIPVSISSNGTQVTDTFTPLNSTLEYTDATSGWSLVSSIQYDEDGNLWALNGFADEPLKAYSADGNWYSFDCGSAARNKFTRKLTIDYTSNKWFSIEGAGLYGYNDGGTLADPSDDKYVQLNSGDFSGALPSNTVTAVAVDFDNEIWIGTDNGFAVLYNAESAFDAGPGEYNASRIKLEFEGNVEFVLGNTNVTDIEVDGGNRKWFGTANSGLILLSADGLEIIEQFTTENSPLISNNIIDLELNQQTGELFVVTDKGLVSYRTDATYEDPTYSTVTVFPNPARPEFQGPITIQGIKYDSDVKVTDIAGNLVYKTVSNGGTATWNGKTMSGERVKTGVYLIWTAPNEGKGRKVGKVLVVN